MSHDGEDKGFAYQLPFSQNIVHGAENETMNDTNTVPEFKACGSACSSEKSLIHSTTCVCKWIRSDTERRLRAVMRSLQLSYEQMNVLFQRFEIMAGECCFAPVVGTNPPRCTICSPSGLKETKLQVVEKTSKDQSLHSGENNTESILEILHMHSSNRNRLQAIKESTSYSQCSSYDSGTLSANSDNDIPKITTAPCCSHARTHFNSTANTKRNVIAALFILYQMGTRFPMLDQTVTPAWRCTQPTCYRGVKYVFS